MQIYPILRCVTCEKSLGVFSLNKSRYECGECGQIYVLAEGILDCLDPVSSDDPTQPYADHLSSFAHPMTREADVTELNLRLQPLYSKVFHGGAKSPMMFLDVGCGFGSLLAAASKRFDLVIGVNTDYNELRSAAIWLEQQGVRNALLVRASAQKLPFVPEQFSAVTCVQVLEHVRSPELALAELKMTLAAGSAFYLSLPNRFTLRREPHMHLRGIGFLPRRVSMWYASRRHRLEVYESVNLLSVSQVSGWLRQEFGNSFELIRSGYHHSALGLLAKLVWNVPLLSYVARNTVGDIEVIVWH